MELYTLENPRTEAVLCGTAAVAYASCAVLDRAALGPLASRAARVPGGVNERRPRAAGSPIRNAGDALTRIASFERRLRSVASLRAERGMGPCSGARSTHRFVIIQLRMRSPRGCGRASFHSHGHARPVLNLGRPTPL